MNQPKVLPRLGGTLLLLMLIGLSGGAALAETGKPPDAHAALRGAKLCQRHCQSWHGERGVGEPLTPFVRRPDYFPAPALDDSQHAWHHSDEDLAKIILGGLPPRMPAWKNRLC